MDLNDPPVLIPQDRIAQRVAELGRQISSDYAGSDELLLVGVLRGCYIFLSDLSRCLTLDRRIDFIAVSSYPNTLTQPGAVRLIMDIRTDIAGKRVLIVDDIVDTGFTLNYLVNSFMARGPASLKTCILLRKKECLQTEVQVDYLGFDIPNAWVVGYGLD
ncbi:MAG: hypoxanthine phosphoribosyltransferase, partial [Desulfobacterales bacterium]